MNVLKIRNVWAALLAVGLLAAPPAQAEQRVSAEMLVSVTVLARAEATVASAPARLAISESDIERGWIEVSEPTLLTVRTNSRRGVLLGVSAPSQLIGRVELRGVGTPAAIDLSSGEGWFALDVDRRLETAVTYRLWLGPEATVGTYAWPIRIDATPL